MIDATAFIQAIMGKHISHVWRGHGSAIFLEFGELVLGKNLKNGREGNPKGELTLMIEWSWRIENPRSILGGSFSSEGKWEGMFQKVIGASVTGVEFFGHLPEIAVTLNNGRRVVSFSTVEGQPEWAVLTRKPAIGSLCVRGGRLRVEQTSS